MLWAHYLSTAVAVNYHGGMTIKYYALEHNRPSLDNKRWIKPQFMAVLIISPRRRSYPDSPPCLTKASRVFYELAPFFETKDTMEAISIQQHTCPPKPQCSRVQHHCYLPIVWMPDSPRGTLSISLCHKYSQEHNDPEGELSTSNPSTLGITSITPSGRGKD